MTGTPTNRPELVELMARAEWESSEWGKLSESERILFISRMNIALDTMATAGVGVVPLEATAEIRKAMLGQLVNTPEELWELAIAAGNLLGKGE